MITVIALVVGFFLGTTTGINRTESKNNNFAVGDCIRELGDSKYKTIITITSDGFIETEYEVQYFDDASGNKYRLDVYPDGDSLLKVDGSKCK